MQPLRTAIVGLGKMGMHHVRCTGLAPGLELVGACDTQPSRASRLENGIPFTTDLDEVLADCEAVVLAVPTDRHEELGRRILAAGRHLLVEKPLAVTAAACRALEAEARTRELILGVGHVERMNGAYTGVQDRIHTPRFVEGHRLAGFDPRGTEVDVVLDLMIHDLDLVLDIFGASPTQIDAVGVAILSDRVDIANARLEFAGGGLVNLTASRVSQKPVRKLRIFQTDAYFSLDFQSQRAELFSRQEGSVAREVKDPPPEHNPLVQELEQFAAAVRGEPSRMTTVAEGARAVSLANRVMECIEARRSAWSGRAAAGASPCRDAPS